MQNYVIETDENGLELRDHGDSMFPLAGYDEYFSKFLLMEVPWHWHEEIEVVIVKEGSTKVEYVDGFVEIHKGQGVFINSNTLHRLTQTSKVECRIINFVFKAEFLGGRYDSRIYNDYIKPVCSNKCFTAISFDPQVQWEKEVIEHISIAFDIYSHKNFGYELLVQSHLLNVWHLLCYHRDDLLNQTVPVTESKIRLDKIIKYIHSHYDKKLAVKDLANVADISESECYRLFKKTLDTSPNDYILNHRLQVAAIALVEGDQSILNITYDLGFGTPSYFSKKFKKHYHMTPTEFRKKYQ